MLTTEENQLLTRTGPGTPMGELFRRFWLPALLSTELPEPDCPPVKLTILSEDLVAFRDTDGRVGVLLERSLNAQFLSNTYLVGDEVGGSGAFIDAGGPVDSLIEAADHHRLTPTHVLLNRNLGLFRFLNRAPGLLLRADRLLLRLGRGRGPHHNKMLLARRPG